MPALSADWEALISNDPAVNPTLMMPRPAIDNDRASMVDELDCPTVCDEAYSPMLWFV